MGKKYYPLDFLKFIGAFLILLHHYEGNTELVLLSVFGKNFYWGLIVEFFFLVSGFLAANSIEKARNQSFVDFISNKIGRLYPMAIITVIFYAVGEWIYFNITGIWYRDVYVGIWNLLASICLIFKGGAIGNIELGANNPVWYLCVLLICYLVYFGLIKLAKKWEISPMYFFAGMILVGLSVLTYSINFPFLNGAVARGYMAFFFGACFYYILLIAPQKQSIVVSLIVLIFVALPKLLCFPEIYDNSQMIVTFLVYPAIITIFLNTKWINSLMGKRAEYGGGVSYEIYLWHGPCLIFQGILLALGVIHRVTYKVLFVFMIIVIGISCFMYSFVEKKLYVKMREIMHDFFSGINW